ncbi:hypothetical protein NM688_g1988 [Phlebia brevispora]|uniref:Uncharacterized protein n=1 Tax=Phlebia brevispora TaxID=194682 RepID=A0ACC1TAJ9_9APHY|nr:hypothetical protein NM688_g1988 [Phlebia brevispora]
MFDEIAQNEEDAEDYDLEALEHRTEALQASHLNDDDDAATLVGHRPGSMAEDAVVFEIGDEDAQELSDDDDGAKKGRAASSHHEEGADHEREGLMKDA